ncbi:50S ribosome-binding GTPase [Patescibacteria group bacterium]|nr:50S ribosome-binding GTPase [Patescibacteria group bacterium]MBU0777043.1 50S ribosome-binding GTPase [Patescibacteria group bacterium]MBU0923213.1 50S ribosome-binding GTPase [Patescibacteria group bacterium]MBU1066503.1 50S ribosome-binding GTPase [Patescibacteria group bacterium]MBU1844387.1 50S ribosome-binding GTPase [Patescibacteria group bacterium]
MTDITEQISNIEKEIRETPYHKGTEHYIGKLRAKLARLREKQLEETFKSKGSGGGGYAVRKQGDATVVLVGPPSAGKSTLLNKVTNAQSKIAAYEFTTLTVIPGMLDYKDAKIQILDVPGLIEGAEIGKGRGREVLSVVRGADLLILISDIQRPGVFKNIETALYDSGIRINTSPPEVNIEKKLKGGIIIHSNIKQNISKETIKEMASSFRISNGEIVVKEKLTMERLIDAFSRNRTYIPAIYVINKSDMDKNIGKKKLENVDIVISSKEGINIDKFKELMWEKLELVKIYLIREKEEPSTNNPLIMKKGQTLGEVAKKIGEEFAEDKERAIIWGSGSKFPGQEISLSTEIKEGMMVRFI